MFLFIIAIFFYGEDTRPNRLKVYYGIQHGYIRIFRKGRSIFSLKSWLRQDIETKGAASAQNPNLKTEPKKKPPRRPPRKKAGRPAARNRAGENTSAPAQ